MKILSTLLFGFLFQIGALQAQPFSELEIGFSGSHASLQSTIYSERWGLTISKSFHARTPFYFGIAGFNLDFFTYETKNDVNMDVISMNVSSYFGFHMYENNIFRLSPGLLIGVQRTDSEIRHLSGKNNIEIELFYSAVLEPQLRFSKVIIFGDFQFRRIFNYHRQDIFFYGVGTRIHLPVPRKVSEFIK